MNEHKSIPVTGIILLFLIVCAGGFLLLKFWQASVQTRLVNLQKAIASLTNEFPVAEITLSQVSPEISGRVVLFSPSGQPLQSEAFEMGGSDLYLEFLIIQWSYSTNSYVCTYPVRLYSDTIAASDGIEILARFTNALAEGGQTEKLAYLLISGQLPDEVSITQSRTVAVHQYPGKSWQTIPYLVLYRQNGTIELREK